MTYPEESFLQLSGLQHFAFCRRQWALIHVEDQWAENFRTMDGQLFHQKAHDTGFAETRGDRVVKRGSMMRMLCSCAARPCAWRRCSAVPSPPERSITESLAAESRWCLRKNCEQRCVRR